MYIKMINLYGISNHNAYFRKIGNSCFDFVNDKKYASNLTNEEIFSIMAHKKSYCKMYNAKNMIIE